MDDTLIIVDSTAFIVSVKNGTVITTLGGNDLRGSAITNINGTVIVSLDLMGVNAGFDRLISPPVPKKEIF